MSYGLEVWNENGEKILSISDYLVKIAYTTVASSGSSGSKNLPEIDGRTTIVLSHPQSGGDGPHKAYRDGNTIYWEPLDSPSYDNANSLILVILKD